MILSFFKALLVFIPALPLHILLCRFTGSTKFMLKSLLLGFFMGILFLIYQYQSSSFDIVSLYLFSTLWLIYLICSINLLNSVTLKMLEFIANSTSRKMHYNEFDRHFTEEDSIGSRLKAMEDNNFITQNEDSVKLKVKGEILASIVLVIRKIFSIKEVG